VAKTDDKDSIPVEQSPAREEYAELQRDDFCRPPYSGERVPVGLRGRPLPTAWSAAATLVGECGLQAKVMRNPRLVEDTSDIDVGQGNQARWVQRALSRLRADGLVLDEHSRPDLRRKIEEWIEAEIKRTDSRDRIPSRQVMDRVLDDWGLPPRGRLLNIR
jgi:hypothetical protein